MSEGRISWRRRFRHLTFRYDTLEKACFCKVIRDIEESRAEMAGYELVRGLYKVPIRYSITHDRKGRSIFSYEYLYSIGTDKGLFLDLINQSYLSNNDLVEAFSNELTSHYFSIISRTLDKTGKTERKTALYEDRIREGGRIDRYYYDVNSKVLSNGRDAVAISEFDQFGFVINGGSYRFDWNECVRSLREYFDALDRTWTGITQGDPTGLNLGFPLVWLDFENAGYNAIFGEFANFCWDTYVFGGYLVPRYSPHSIRDHAATLRFLPLNTPEIDRFEIDRRSKQIIVDYRIRLPSTRRLILKTYFDGLMKPLVAKTGSVHWQSEFARYLSLRIIGVFDIFSMNPSDLLFSLVKLIEAHDESFDFHRFFAV